MPGLLGNVPVSDEQRRRNDTHRPLVVVTVLAVIAVYAYLFTHASETLGLPAPSELAARLDISVGQVFDRDGNVDSNVYIPLTRRIRSSDDERLVFYLILVAAFLCVYFLPLSWKQPALVFWTAEAVLVLYGVAATAGLFCAHLIVFLVMHPGKRGNLALSALAGLAAYWGFFDQPRADPWQAGLLGALPLASMAIFRYGLLPLLAMPRVAPVLHTLAIQSAILTVGVSAVIEGMSGAEWSLPLGLLLFFWQWERLIMYHVDYKDGLIPEDVDIGRYLAVFWNPGAIPNWTWGVTIAQGYAYTSNNFLCEDKNKLVMSGVKLWLIALIYLVFSDWIVAQLMQFFNGLGVPVHRARTKTLAQDFLEGDEIGTVSVLVTTLLDLARWTMLWAGVVHFKVGIWRVCGYRVDPYIFRPWASTNLVVLWSRFTYHYREFLVRAFYYPVFFRFFKQSPYLRVFVATLAAAGFGNLVWGHVTEGLYYRGMQLENALNVLQTWPYFVLLGVGIAVTQCYLMARRRTREPWTLDRWLVTDVLAVYCTLQYYALIRIFSHPAPGSTVWDSYRLFMKGFGVEI